MRVFRSSQMPTYRVIIINEHFSTDGEHEASDDAAAWQQAMASAVAIGGEQISHGNPFFGAEVRLEQGERQIGRYIVSVGATTLKD